MTKYAPYLLFLCLTTPLIADEIVENGTAPKGAEQTLKFTEDLRFGGDEEAEDHYLWASLKSDLSVMADGTILVADPKTNQLRAYDDKGQHIRLVAGEGMGPGEMQALFKVTVLPDGRVVIMEAKPMFLTRFQIFDKDLNFERIIQPAGMSHVPIAADVSPDGKRFAGVVLNFDVATGNMVTATGLGELDNYKVSKTFSSFSRKIDMAAMATPAGFGDMIGDMMNGFYAGSGVFSFTADGRFYSAVTDKYEITLWDKDFETKKRVIRRKYKPTPNTPEQINAIVDNLADDFRDGPMAQMITDTFLQRVIDKSDPPPTMSPVNGLLTTPDGHLLVIHKMDFITGDQTVDIFDPAGKFLGQTALPHWAFMAPDHTMRMEFTKDYAYTIVTDEDDVNQVVRYKFSLAKK